MKPKRSINKWECVRVELIRDDLSIEKYNKCLAGVAAEMYPLMYQLCKLNRSSSLHYPGETLESKTGVIDGNNNQNQAA